MSKMTDENHNVHSPKMATEVKEGIRKLAAAGIELSRENIVKETGCGQTYVYQNPEVRAFWKELQEKQKEQGLRIDTEFQNLNLHNKLMGSYIFAYSLLDEQEEFYKTAIAELKDRDKPFVMNDGSTSAIDFICQILSEETDPSKIAELLEKFEVSFSESIPGWKEQLLEKLDKCLAKDILEKKYK